MQKGSNSDREYVTWTLVELRPQIISQVAEQLPKISFLSPIPFSRSLLQKCTQREMSLSQQSRRNLNLNKQEAALLFLK